MTRSKSKYIANAAICLLSNANIISQDHVKYGCLAS